MNIKILAIEPYYGGSHRAFLDGWIANSRHDWTLVTYKAHGWKWRMRHSGMSSVQDVAKLVHQGDSWDVVFCSDMLPLAEFNGLAPADVQKLPKVIYFHENQLTYPIANHDQFDLHFGLVNMSSALAADQVWFNSGYHRQSFHRALTQWLGKMRSPQLLDRVEEIVDKSIIHPPGVEYIQTIHDRIAGPVNLLWAARWEYDKNPQTFFDALEILDQRRIDFRLNVIGEQFRQSPPVFAIAEKKWANRIDRWGYQSSRQEYVRALAAADIMISSAEHEFFGIGAVEAACAGAYPLLPHRLAYPEVFEIPQDTEKIFYDGSSQELASKIETIAIGMNAVKPTWCDEKVFDDWKIQYSWPTRSKEMDDHIEAVAFGQKG